MHWQAFAPAITSRTRCLLHNLTRIVVALTCTATSSAGLIGCESLQRRADNGASGPAATVPAARTDVQPATASLSNDPSASAQPTFWSAAGLDAAERFDLARRSEPELIAFLRRFPKGADLHNHAGGAMYAEYLLDAARDKNLRYDPATKQFTSSTGSTTVTMDQLESNGALLKDFLDTISMRGFHAGTANGHDHFFATFPYLGSAGRSNVDILAELINRNRYQQVNYLELMMMPAPVAASTRFEAAFSGLDLNDLDRSFAPYRKLIDDPAIHAAFRAELDSWEQGVMARLNLPAPPSDANAEVHVRYIGSLNRAGPIERFFGTAIFVFTAMRADPRVVGLNIVAPEDAPAARRQFAAQMKILDYLWQQFDKPAITLHAAELSLTESPVEPMQDRIRRSIGEGHARRIGHGTSVAWERDLPGLLDDMRSHGVLVEISLSSSEGILNVAGDRHALPMYRSAGVPVCLSTDDEGVSRSNLTMEYVKAVQRYDLRYDEVKALSRDCLSHSFLPAPVMTARLAQLELAFERFEASLANGFRE